MAARAVLDTTPRAAGQSRRRLSPTGGLLVAAAVAGLGSLLALPGLWLAPVQVIAVFEDLPGQATVTALIDNDPRQAVPLRSWSLMQPCRVTITATGQHNLKSGSTAVFARPIVDSHDVQLSPDGYKMGPGWSPWALGGRWFAAPKEGCTATMTWSGWVTDCAILPMPMSPDSGIVTVRWNDESPRTIDLYAPSEKWHTDRFVPPLSTAKWIGRLPFRLRGLGLRVVGGEATCCRVTVLWGERVLFERHERMPVGGEPVTLAIPPVRASRIIAWAGLNGLRTMGRACLWGLVSLILGLPVVWPILGRLNLFERYVVMLIVGAALPIVLSVSLTRMHCSGTLSFWFTVVTITCISLGLLARSAVRGGDRLRQLVPTRAQAGVILALAATAAACSMVLFYPILSFPNWFVGHSYTDSQFYINAAEVFRQESLNVLRQDGWLAQSPVGHLVPPLLSYTVRSGDYLALLDTALLDGTDTRSAFAQLHLNWWFTFPLVGYCLFGALGCRPKIIWAGVVCLSAFALLYEIFSQDYLSQFLTAGLLLDLLLVTGFYLVRMNDPGLARREHAAFIAVLGILLAASVSIYPPQCLFPLVLATVMFGSAVFLRSWRPVGILMGVGLAAVISSNLGLVSLLSAGTDFLPFLDKLNQIARWVVFTFYKRPVVFGSILYGMRDWVLLSSFAPAITQEVLPAGSAWLCSLSKALAATSKVLLVPCVLLTLLGIYDCLRRSWQARLLAIATTLYVLMAAALAWKGQLYASCKQLITCGALLLPCMIVGMDALLRRTTRRSVRAALGIFLGTFLACNLRSVWFDNSAYLMTAYHPVLFKARTHVGALTEDLRELAANQRMDDLRNSNHVAAIVGNFIPGRGTDRDRVTMEYVHHTLRGYRVIHDPIPQQWEAQRPLLALVFNGFSLPTDMVGSARILLSNTTFVLYEIGGPS